MGNLVPFLGMMFRKWSLLYSFLHPTSQGIYENIKFSSDSSRWHGLIVLWYLADVHFAPWEHFASKWHGTLCIPTHFSSQHTLLPDRLYSSEHFTPQHTLHLSTLCSSAHLAPWNSLLPGTLCYLEHFTLSGPGCKVSWGGKVTREQCVPDF